MNKQDLDAMRERYKGLPIQCARDVNALLFEIERLQAERDNKGCGWCNRKDEYDRFECTLINHEGSDMVVDHMIVSCIADYCPVCGRRLDDQG